MRALDFMMGNDMFDYPKSEIAEKSGVSRDTLNKLWPGLLESGILKKTRNVGNADMYSLNSGSSVAWNLQELDFSISSRFADTDRATSKA